GLQTLETMAQPSAYLPNRDTGTLTLASTLFEREAVIQPFLKAVLKLAPALTVEIIPPGSSMQASDLLEQDHADFVLLPDGMLSGDAIMSRKIMSFDSMVFFDANFPLAEQDIDAFCDRPQITVSLGNEPGLAIDRQLARIKKARHVAARVRNFESAMELIKGTPLIATLPKTKDLGNVKGIGGVPLPHPLHLPTINHHLYWHRRKQPSNRHGYWRKVIAEASASKRASATG
ncbi:MAG: LysR substrate-binding domain-containing protein, partial [Pseudomonadota bacterium]